MILLLMCAGFALLAAGTYRQSSILFGRLPRRRIRVALLGGGHALLAVSLAVVLAGPDMGRQLVQWVGLLTVGALVVLIGVWLRSDHPRSS